MLMIATYALSALSFVAAICTFIGMFKTKDYERAVAYGMLSIWFVGMGCLGQVIAIPMHYEQPLDFEIRDTVSPATPE